MDLEEKEEESQSEEEESEEEEEEPEESGEKRTKETLHQGGFGGRNDPFRAEKIDSADDHPPLSEKDQAKLMEEFYHKFGPGQLRDNAKKEPGDHLDLSQYSRGDLNYAVNHLDREGALHLVAGKSEEDLKHAIQCFQHSLIIKKDTLDTEMPEICDTLFVLGTLHSRNPSDLQLAKEAFDEVRRIVTEVEQGPALLEDPAASPPKKSPAQATPVKDTQQILEKTATIVQKEVGIPAGLGTEDQTDRETIHDLAEVLTLEAARAPPDSKGVALAMTTAAYLYLTRAEEATCRKAVKLYEDAMVYERARLGDECPEAAEIGTLLLVAYNIVGEPERRERLLTELQDLVSRHPEKAFDKARKTLAEIDMEPVF